MQARAESRRVLPHAYPRHPSRRLPHLLISFRDALTGGLFQSWPGLASLNRSSITLTPMTKVLRFTDLIAEGKVAGKRVFIRADLNVPQDDQGNITEDTRVRASVPAIQAALAAGAAVMVTSHLGRPTEGQFKPEDSLAPVAKRLSELLGRDMPLLADWVDGVQVQPGQVVLLENCRCNKGEKKNDDALSL